MQKCKHEYQKRQSQQKQSTAGSVKGSRVGTKDSRMEDVDDVDEKFLPNHIFIQPKEHTTPGDLLGFFVGEKAEKVEMMTKSFLKSYVGPISDSSLLKKNISYSSTTITTVELLQDNLMNTPEWTEVQAICANHGFAGIPQLMSRNYALSFLL